MIAIIGDGSFQYSVQSLWTAAQAWSNSKPTMLEIPISAQVPRSSSEEHTRFESRAMRNRS